MVRRTFMKNKKQKKVPGNKFVSSDKADRSTGPLH